MATGNATPINDGDINGLQAFIDNALDGLESTELTQEQRDAVVEMLSEFETEVLDLYERQQQDLQQAQPEASQADGAPPDYENADPAPIQAPVPAPTQGGEGGPAAQNDQADPAAPVRPDRKAGQVDETDSDGNPFVKNSRGSTVWGRIGESISKFIRGQVGDIKLSLGNDTYGLTHIEKRHGQEIRSHGYNSIEEFVDDTVNNFNQIRKTGGALMLVKKADKNNVAIVRLVPSESGDYYRVETAGIFSTRYLDKFDLLWEGNSLPPDTSGTDITDYPAQRPLDPGDARVGATAESKSRTSVEATSNPDTESNIQNSKKPDNARAGSPIQVDFKADGTERHNGRYAIVDTSVLTPSHNPDGTPNRRHRISEGQPRDRSDADAAARCRAQLITR